MRKNRGITLIALVITIIVLLILVGVSVASLTGENGLLEKSGKAANEYKRQAAEEKIKLAIIAYQINKENTTVYDELIKIEGLTFITPNDKTEGPPYTVIVDGYEFFIKEDLKIEYKEEKDEKGNQPEIIKVEYETEEVDKLEITITAITEDIEGLQEIRVNYKKVEGEEIKYELVKVEEVGGKEASITVEIPINGDYCLQAIGKNKKIGKKEITINNIREGSVLVSVTAGEVNDEAKAMLTIMAESQGKAIQKMELFVAGKSTKTYEYESLEQNRQENYRIENLEFYKSTECYVKVWDNKGKEIISEIEVAKNTKIIKTATDLRNLAIQVNEEDNTFEGRTIQVIEDIIVGSNWIPIGYWDAIGLFTGKSFAGTFEGNNHTVTIPSLSKEERYKTSGLFGMVIGGNISNVIVKGTMDAKCEYVGGIVGGIKNGKVINCINNSEITDTTLNGHGGIVGILSDKSQIINCINNGTIYGNSIVGGISGIIDDDGQGECKIFNCTNSGRIKCFGTSEMIWGTAKQNYGIAGGICGEAYGERHVPIIEKCTNTGEVTGNASTIFPNGIVAGGIVGFSHQSIITKSKNTGKIHYDINSGITNNGGALGGIVGASVVNTIVEQCFNTGTVTSKYNNNYGMYNSGGIAGYMASATIKNSYNRGSIYGYGNIGGIIGTTEAIQGIQGKNYFNNNYNASEIVMGQTIVGNYGGEISNGEGSYNAAIINQTGVAGGTNNNFGAYEEYTLQQMKTIGLGLLTLLNNGEGNGIWEQSLNINDGFPFLKNNRP